MHAEILPADRPGELDHATLDRAQDDDVVQGRGALAVRFDLERRQLRDAVIAREDPGEPGLQLVRLDRREKADAAEIDADDRDVRAVEAVQRSQHRSVAAQHDGDVGAGQVGLGFADAVLLDLLVGKEELDLCIARDLLETFERGPDGRRLAVRDDRGAPDGFS